LSPHHIIRALALVAWPETEYLAMEDWIREVETGAMPTALRGHGGPLSGVSMPTQSRGHGTQIGVAIISVNKTPTPPEV
jgi:hypothetical protein